MLPTAIQVLSLATQLAAFALVGGRSGGIDAVIPVFAAVAPRHWVCLATGFVACGRTPKQTVVTRLTSVVRRAVPSRSSVEGEAHA